MQRVGVEALAKALAPLVRKACENLSPGLPHRALQLHLCAGVAGAADERVRTAVAKALRARLQAHMKNAALASLQVVADGAIAVAAALGSDPGVAVVVGTGAVVLWQSHEGMVRQYGGWGHLLGDEGGGVRLGRAGLGLVMACFDGAPETPMVAALRKRFGLNTRGDLVRKVYREAWPVQEVAPAVLDAAAAGDSAAEALVAAQAGMLVAHVERAIAHAGAPQRIVVMGGLAEHPAYRRRLEALIQARCPGSTLHPPQHRDPVMGAVLMAQKAYRNP